MPNFTTVPPLSLYVHWPWCVRKCPYCDFNSHEAGDSLPEQAYIDALLADLESELPAVWGRSVTSVFIGGGTPSLMSPDGLEHLLSGVRARLNLLPDAEITLEANPGSLEHALFSEIRGAGVNRLSLGIQSFDDELLRRIGRIHGRQEAIAAAEAAHRAGFAHLNLDLMFGLPGQTRAQAMADLTTAVALGPGHLSWYQLTIEPNTAFHHQPPVLPEDERLWEMQQAGEEQLATAGYRRYEVSAYAREGRTCRHNLNYWRFGDYLGIGAGAHGKLTHPAHGRIERRWKLRHPREYLTGAQGGALAGTRDLGPEEAAFEFMLNALRLADGFESSLFAERTGLPLSAVETPLREAEARGLIEWDRQGVYPTRRGRDFLNDLLELFLPV